MEAWFLSLMSIFGIVILTLFLLFLAFMWYRQHSAPGPGVVLGAYTIFGRYAGQKVHSELRGMMVDSTGFFCSSDMTSAFKELLYLDVGHMLENLQEEPKPEQNPEQATQDSQPSTSDPASQVTQAAEQVQSEKVKENVKQSALQSAEQAMLEKVKSQLENYPLEQICRVSIIRNSGDSLINIFAERHLIVSFHDPKRSLSDYASNEEQSHFTLGFGPVNKGVIVGSMQTLIEPWEFPNERFPLGKFPVGTVHILVPEEPSALKTKEERKAAAKDAKERLDVAKPVLSIPNMVHINNYVKSLKQQIRDKDIQLQDMGEDLSAATAECAYYRRTLKGFNPEEPGGPKIMAPKKVDILDGLVLFLFPTVFYAVTQAFGLYPLFGVIGGLAIALYIVYRRR